MRTLLLAVALSLAACGGPDPEDAVPEGDPTPEQLTARIERLSEVRKEKVEPPQRMTVLTDAEIPAELRSGPSCRLAQGNGLLLLAGAAGAVAKIDGRPVRLRVNGPVGPSGGFFEAEGVTVSIGRRAAPAEGGGAPVSPAGATVGGRPGTPFQKVAGSWACIR